MTSEEFPYLDENTRISFPLPEEASEDGVVAWGGNLSPGMLLSAYSQGVFPWYDEFPILWWNPDPRCVLFPEKLHVSKRMERTLKSGKFIIKSDSNFKDVITNCAKIKRKHEQGTWINDDIISSYTKLHELGWAHSIEAYMSDSEDGNSEPVLVGGLYGISLGGCFFGESMFSKETDSSKAAFIFMVRELSKRGIKLVDCQIMNPHLASFGAENIPRQEYMILLDELLKLPDLRGQWELN
ncbi:MAG: leucyl/phenylalanyl-tRNA--protein transferase [Spirochaetales bacterium]|nr:leucyl/phenylalanyl-tRNA--protein transferase [Spirochaetales bacterium]